MTNCADTKKDDGWNEDENRDERMKDEIGGCGMTDERWGCGWETLPMKMRNIADDG